MTGSTEVGARGEEEKVAVVRDVGVMAHITILARLSRRAGMLRQAGIENIAAARRYRAVVAAITERLDARKRLAFRVGALGPERLAAGVVGEVAGLAGRDAGISRYTEVVLAIDRLALLTQSEPESHEAGQQCTQEGCR
jgi:hypothetical protein